MNKLSKIYALSLIACVLGSCIPKGETPFEPFEPKPILSSDGKTITYGIYPQTVLIDSDGLYDTLNSEALFQPNGWYKYNDEYYAKVIATPYESDYVFNNESAIVSGATYWFKCEPIVWDVLSNNNGEYYVLSSVLLDTHCYYNSDEERIMGGQTVHANNYKYSDIRVWLNNDFYKSAFLLGNGYIQTTTVDNSAASTNDENNIYACANTEDKVCLLSYQDYLNVEYGFGSDGYVDDTRECETTDWARSRGACEPYAMYGYHDGDYWTRSPDGEMDEDYIVVCVDECGTLRTGWSVASPVVSVRPAITIRLEESLEDPVETFTVVWRNYDGTVLEVDEGVERGTYPEYNGETPTRSDSGGYSYTFSGWDPELKKVEEDIDYYAEYDREEITYHRLYVSYDTSYGKVTIDSYSIANGYEAYLKSNTTMSISAINKTSTVPFYCWCGNNLNTSTNTFDIISKNPNINFTMPNSDYFLGAIWDYFDIEYELNGGRNNNNNPDFYTSTYGTIQLYNPTKSGYSFVRWDLSGAKVSGNSIVSYSRQNVTSINCSQFAGQITLTAVWE